MGLRLLEENPRLCQTRSHSIFTSNLQISKPILTFYICPPCCRYKNISEQMWSDHFPINRDLNYHIYPFYFFWKVFRGCISMTSLTKDLHLKGCCSNLIHIWHNVFSCRTLPSIWKSLSSRLYSTSLWSFLFYYLYILSEFHVFCGNEKNIRKCLYPLFSAILIFHLYFLYGLLHGACCQQGPAGQCLWACWAFWGPEQAFTWRGTVPCWRRVPINFCLWLLAPLLWEQACMKSLHTPRRFVLHVKFQRFSVETTVTSLTPVLEWGLSLRVAGCIVSLPANPIN